MAMARVHANYTLAHGRLPNVLVPRRYTEKVQWRKLFDMNPLYATLSDKLAVRGFIASKVGETQLVPLIWSGSAADIPFDRLRAPYVLKSSHASGHCILIGPDEEVQRDVLRARAADWLSQRYGVMADEPGYVPVPPRLMIEQTVMTDAGKRPDEVRLFVFDGKVAVANTVFVEDNRIRNGAFHTRDWVRLDWHFSRVVDREFSRPRRLSDMIRIAECLGAELDHIRVDFYDCGDRIYVGEITLYPWSGSSRFNPDEADFALGAYWRLSNPLRRALTALLCGRREIVPIAPGADPSEQAG
jgi:TupA-like ATPgrasp